MDEIKLKILEYKTRFDVLPETTRYLIIWCLVVFVLIITISTCSSP